MRFFVALKTLLLGVALSLLIAAPASAAETQYIIKGYGYGHGIGMCQWGAKGRADAGQSYETILEHYYQGASVTSNYSVPSIVRVRLFGKANVSKVYVEGDASSAYNFVKTDGTFVYQGATGKSLIMPTATGLLKVLKADGTVLADNVAAPLIITNATNNLIIYDSAGKRKHAYKGSMYIYPNNASTLYVVNYVNFEPDYLNGLGEMPSSWPYNALYTQAIAARTYAIKVMKPTANFDLYDDTNSQVYNGVDKVNYIENGIHWGARWAKAVTDTAGQVVVYGGTPIAAYYHSSCGGQTENIEFAWTSSKASPYLKSVSDKNSSGKAYCQQSSNTSFSWESKVSKSSFESKLGITGITNVVISKRGVSPRAVELTITKQDGSKTTMKGDTFRSKLGLKSSWISQMGGTFSDVPLGYWAFSQIESLASSNVVGGYSDGTFKPAANVTRGEFAKMLSLALNIPTGSSGTFTDTGGHWAEKYIAGLVSSSIVGGYNDGTFKPNNPITRAEIAAIIARAKNLTTGSSAVSFNDIEGHWAKDSILLAASNGIITGYPDSTFKPGNSATRAEVAAIIYRAR